jgi:hypothetical protein
LAPIVAVSLKLLPPLPLEGEEVSPVTAGARTFRLALALEPFTEAVTLAFASKPVIVVFTANVPEVDATFTKLGTVAPLALKLTLSPPLGAGPVKVTVAVDP